MNSLKSNGKYSPVKLIVAITGLLTVLSGTALAWYKTIAGEPEASEVRSISHKAYGDIKKTLTDMKIKWEKIEKAVAEQGKVVELQTRRLIMLQGIQSGLTSGQLLAKHEMLQQRYDRLIARRGGKLAVQLLQDELRLERKMRKLAKVKATRLTTGKPTAIYIDQIKLPPPSPFRKTK